MKTPTLTVRIGRQRVNHAKLLESQLEALAQQARRLQRHNAALRAKEDMQFDMLSGYEDAMERMSSLLCDLAGQEGPDAAAAAAGAALSAVMLALRGEAQHLLTQLPPSGPAADAPHASSNAVDNSSRCAVAPAVGGCCGRQTPLIWSRITPDAVLDMKGITTRQLAEQFRAAVARIALIRHCASRSSVALQDSVGGAVLDYGELVLLAMMAADRQFLEFNTWNMEKMQVDTQPPDLASHVFSHLKLSQQQRQQLAVAFGCCHDQRTSLLQQQEAVIAQLQHILAAPGCGPPLQDYPASTLFSTAVADTAVLLDLMQAVDTTAATAAAATSQRAVPPAAAAGAEGAGSNNNGMHERQAAHASTSNGSGSGTCSAAAAAADAGTAAGAAAAHTGTAARAAAAAHAGTAAGAAASRQGHFGADYSRLQDGLLDLELAELADGLLLQLQRINRLEREACRGLIHVWMDVLTLQQHADVILAAYPFTYSVAPLCRLISQQVNHKAEAAALRQHKA